MLFHYSRGALDPPILDRWMPEIAQSRKSTSVIQFFVLCCKQNGGILKYQSEKSYRFSNFTCMLVVTLNRKISVLVIKLHSRRWCLIHFTLWLRSCNAIFVFASFFHFLSNIIINRSIDGHAWLIDCTLFNVPLESISFTWRRDTFVGEGLLVLEQGGIFRVTPDLTLGLVYCELSTGGGEGGGGGGLGRTG